MESIWTKTYDRKKKPPLEGDIDAEAAVIGGGMAGILTAWHLQKAGIRTVVLEADLYAHFSHYLSVDCDQSRLDEPVRLPA